MSKLHEPSHHANFTYPSEISRLILSAFLFCLQINIFGNNSIYFNAVVAFTEAY